MNEESEALKRQRRAVLEEARRILDTAERQGRELIDGERAKVDNALSKADQLEITIEELERAGSRNRATSGLAPRMDRYASRGPVTGRPAPERSMYMDNDLEGFSLVKTIRALVGGDWREASAERAICDQAEKEFGVARAGAVRIPLAALGFSPAERRQLERQEQRDLIKGTAAAGGYMVGTELTSFIDRLVNRMVMAQAGVTFLTGLVGDVAIPRLATGVTSYWVAENTAPTEGSMTFEQVTLSPKANAAYIDISRKLLQQASLDVENMVRNDIARSIALALDKAILLGAGTNEPTGLKNTTGVTDCSGDNGEAISWAEVLQLETTVATANADVGKVGYISNPTLRGKMKSTLITATYGDRHIWDQSSPAAPVNGYPCHVTGQIGAAYTKGSGSGLSLLFFGAWSDIVVGSWGSLDVLVDPYSLSTTGAVRLVAFNDCDVCVRHPAGFAMGYYS